MSSEIQKNEESSQNYQTQIVNFENGLLNFLDQHNLPSNNIFVGVRERIKVFQNVELVLEEIPNNERNGSIYLSKFIAGVATGLFDASLNYLWDETILQIRKRVIQYDLEYFYDNAVSNSDKRKKLKDDSDIIKLDDYELIKGAKEIGLISDLGFKHLEYINYMRNWASAAHPNQNELTGLQLISWLETCVKEVITLPISNVAIRIKELLAGIKKTTISDDDAKEISTFFENLSQEQINNLTSGFFGIFINSSTDVQARQNIIKLLPLIWDEVSENVKFEFGIKYANFAANNNQDEKKYARNFLKIVEAESYIPDSLRVVEIETAINNLTSAHHGYNNFYSEPTFARQLKTIIGIPPKVPKNIERKYVLSIVDVYLTNGSGTAWNAETIYEELIEHFDESQSIFAAFSFLDDTISSKLQFDRCVNKFKKLLGEVKNNITTPQIRELVEEIESKNGKLDNLRIDSQIKRRLIALRIMKNK